MNKSEFYEILDINFISMFLETKNNRESSQAEAHPIIEFLDDYFGFQILALSNENIREFINNLPMRLGFPSSEYFGTEYSTMNDIFTTYKMLCKYTGKQAIYSTKSQMKSRMKSEISTIKMAGYDIKEKFNSSRKTDLFSFVNNNKVPDYVGPNPQLIHYFDMQMELNDIVDSADTNRQAAWGVDLR